MTHLSAHVLDATTGRPAAGITVVLTDADGSVLAERVTNDEGRVPALFSGQLLGTYRLRFDTATYFAGQGVTTFYPEVLVTFEITDPGGGYHVPLLLSPFAYTTYRGS